MPREVYELSTLDYLTRAYNRREFEHLLRAEAARVNRYGGPLSLVVFDLDNFRHINDRFGYQEGDNTLKALADALKNNIRASDLLARWADEEFMILSPLELMEATGFAVKLRRFIAENTFSQFDRLTASFGVCQYRRGETIMEFVGRAESAMYRAKNSGRNRISAEKI